MKKVLKSLVLLVVALLLMTQTSVHADMGAPTFISYQMQVINPNGVPYYNYDDSLKGTVPKDTIVTIDYESYKGESKFYSIKFKDATNKEQNGRLKNLNGLVMAKDELTIEDAKNDSYFHKYDTKKKALVYKDGGVAIRKGPSSAYAEVGRLEEGTIVEYEYSIGSDGDDSTYIYIETNNVKGWIIALEKEVLVQNDAMYIFRVDKVTPKGTIPANTIIKPEYRSDPWTGEALFKYNGIETMIKTRWDDKGTVVYINGDKASQYSAKEKIDIHKTADQKSEVVGSIPVSEKFNVLGSYYEDEHSSKETDDYIDYNGIKGWYRRTENNSEYVTNVNVDVNVTAQNIVEENTVVQNTIIQSHTVENKIKDDKKDAISGETIVLMCTMAGITVALAALMIIILVCKKTKNNVPNQNVNQPMNQPINQNINPIQTTDQNQNNNPGQNG